MGINDVIRVPIFYGDDVGGWVSWVEKFFSEYGYYSEEEKLPFVHGFIEGDARTWFEQDDSLTSWEAIKSGLFVRFGNSKDCELAKTRKHLDILDRLERWMNEDEEKRSQGKVQVEEVENQKIDIDEDLFESMKNLCQDEQMAEQNQREGEQAQDALQVFDKMIMGGNRIVRKRKKRKFTKAKRFKYKCGKVDFKPLQIQKMSKSRSNNNLESGNNHFLPNQSSSPTDSVFIENLPVLKYINDMLMDEEDLVGQSRLLQDDSALQAAERSFYEILQEQSPPDSDHNTTSSSSGDSFPGNFSTTTTLTDSSAALVSNGESQRKYRHRNDEEDVLEIGRRNKQPAIFISEMDELAEKMEHVLLVCRANQEEEEAESVVTKQSQPNRTGRGKGSSSSSNRSKTQQKSDSVDLRSLLMQCAQAVASFDQRRATEKLKEIRSHSSSDGDGIQRVAFYFAEALEARITGIIPPPVSSSFPSSTTSMVDILKAYKVFVNTCPIYVADYFAANKSIYELAMKSTTLHIIDFGVLYGFQWPCLLLALSNRPGGPPMLRVTGIELPQSGFRPTERVEETGRRLKRFCDKFSVPFEFNFIAKTWNIMSNIAQGKLVDCHVVYTCQVFEKTCMLKFIRKKKRRLEEHEREGSKHSEYIHERVYGRLLLRKKTAKKKLAKWKKHKFKQKLNKEKKINGCSIVSNELVPWEILLKKKKSQVKLLDPNCNSNDFLQNLLDPSVDQSIANALIILKDIGALTPEEELTDFGEKFGHLPIHPLISKMLFFVELVNCLDPALTLAYAADYKEPFTMPMSPNDKQEAAAAKLELASLCGGDSDHLAVVAAFECWKNAKERGLSAEFCSQYFVSPSAMKMLDQMPGQLKRLDLDKGDEPDFMSLSELLYGRHSGVVYSAMSVSVTHLEDKVNFGQRGIDTWEANHPPVLYTYKRKTKAQAL